VTIQQSKLRVRLSRSDSQIHDLPKLPLSKSGDARWRGRSRARGVKAKIELGRDVSRRCDLRLRFSA